jgi:50S ribosomal protein L16 3-hydroxylase
MLRQFAQIVKRIHWSSADIVDFAGTYLTEPKPHTRFSPPARPAAPATFLATVRRVGVRLAPGSRMLYGRGTLYVNGEISRNAATPPMRRLANDGCLAGGRIPRDRASGEHLYQWYRAGYILVGATPRMRVKNG